MAKDPEERPSSAMEFARALRDAARTRTLGAVLARSQPAVAAGWGLGRSVAPSGRPSSARSFASARPMPSGRLAPSGTRPLTRPHRAPTAPPPAASSTLEPTRINTTPDAPTLYDAGMPPFGGAPQWPLRSGAGDGGPGRRKRLGIAPIAFGLLALVLTILLATTAYNVAASFAGTQTGGSGPGVGKTATATSLPTASPQPTATPFPSDWLNVSPSNISLACHGDG